MSLIKGEKGLCTRCKIELPYTNDAFTHENELSRKFSFNPTIKGAASLLYFYQKGMAQTLLHQLKYHGQRDIGRMLGALFAEKVSELDLDFILPVPIHTKKQRKRGYNQSMEIASGIAEKVTLPIREKVISRTFQSSSQTSKSKVERWKALENVYGEADEWVRGKKVLVIDDVITTGATAGMLCDRLVEKGAAAIYVGAIARGK